MLYGAVAVISDRHNKPVNLTRYAAAAAAGMIPAWRYMIPQGAVVRSSAMQAKAAYKLSAFYN